MFKKFMHVGITVTDIDRMCEFYMKYFGFEKGFGVFFDEGFIGAQPGLYRQPPGTYSDMQMLESPDGVCLEFFRFSNVEEAGTAEWHRTGYHHVALLVDDIPALYEVMKADGVEFFMEPTKRGDGDGNWIFFKDPEGNMIELWD